MNEHTFLIEVGADIVSLHGQVILLIEAGSSQERSKMTDMKQVSYDYCFMRDQPGNGISNDPGVER